MQQEPTNFVSIHDLSKAYPRPDGSGAAETVLKSINLSVSAGEFVAIVGNSGSGKTTLLNIVGAMDVADHGQVIIDGSELSRMSEPERTDYRRRSVGFIFQAYNLIPTLTVLENINLPSQLTQQIDEGNGDELLKQLNLAHRKTHWPDQLSGGEQQRIAIVRALIHKPKLVLADEPTGNLDADNANAVVELLISMVRSQQTTLIMATHNEEICQRADRVLRIRSGELHST